jgi:ubiquitin-protein ligase E3 C
MDITPGMPSGGGWTFSARRPAPYATADQCFSQLQLLVQFVSARKRDDILRLVYFVDALEQTFQSLPTIATEGEWTVLLKRLSRAILSVLSLASKPTVPLDAVEPLLRALVFLTSLIPKQMAKIADTYYQALALLTTTLSRLRQPDSDEDETRRDQGIDPAKLKEGVLALLRPITSETMAAYEAFATSYLTIPSLESYLGALDGLASEINYRMLALAVSTRLAQNTQGVLADAQSRSWLLSYLIFFQRYALGSQANHHAPELEFVTVVSDLLNTTATHLMQGLDADETGDLDEPKVARPLPPFIKDQVTGLVNQNSVTGLLSRIRTSRLPQESSTQSDSDASKEARVLATYALNLLRIFPRRGDDIRMWLYLGSAPSGDQASGLPAIKYFWQASRSSQVFDIISRDSTRVLPLLQLPSQAKEPVDVPQDQRDQEWTTILLFLELYTFVLKVTDDDEFFSSASSFTSSENTKTSWTRESALPLNDVKDMTVFLKNLAFTLYWNAVDLSEPALRPAAVSLSSYFNSTANASSDPLPSTKDLETKNQSNNLPGVTGIPLEYFKGLVTGLLRMLHERDSRRKFLPKDHWLMTSRFDMEGFIPSVVAEEEKRHEFQARAEDNDGTDPIEEEETNMPLGLAGAGHAQQTIRIEAMRRQQQRVARGRILAAIAPRLEILRNMPFFIPFATRVQIFREFIYHDQHRRRRGFVDPDLWRASVAQAAMGQMIDGHPAVQAVLARHQAEIRREHVFDDALTQFYQLGDGLKEPIQISFIDRFGTMEAGIDGGGVTKEFLTSITSEAFKTESDSSSMFAENDQHLLYPNPTALEQCREQLRRSGVSESSPEWQGGIRDLLRRYEFLGRVIGKCLYEGILVDVNFAPFFLLKWALTGGTGSAMKESSYRANLNDLKDLDAGLYQGLLQLKNYSGDVEDFALDFTVTDTISISGSDHRTVTKELRPGGSSIPVTNQNRLVYISYIARYRLQLQPQYQTNAFLQGLGQIIQPAWLSMFNQAELQTLVSGENADIDVEDLRRNTQYGGVYTIGDDNQEHETIQLFWKVMHDLNNEERQKVLRFVTSTPRAPLLGFSHLNPRFSIRDSSEDQERLPSTSTCVNLLKLPRYSNAETLRSKLLYAVSSGAGFDLS